MRKMYYGAVIFTRKFESGCEVLEKYEEPLMWFYNQITIKPERMRLLYFGPFLKIFSLYKNKNQAILSQLANQFLRLVGVLDQDKIRNYLLIFTQKLNFFNNDLLKLVNGQLENFKDFEVFWSEILPVLLEKSQNFPEFTAFQEKLKMLNNPRP